MDDGQFELLSHSLDSRGARGLPGCSGLPEESNAEKSPTAMCVQELVDLFTIPMAAPNYK